ncbi:MAG: IS30 family transposase [Candidatus Omnitrophica bacterium]|nr:IS30 family transposase [Candidatus Omnitrophota bacterium]MBI3010474.1 IS30 family transposase [Candidatus Omnitrophota bacterium]
MPRYHRLSLMEREELSRMIATGASLRTIARVLHRWPSSLSRELARHAPSRIAYRAVRAHARARRCARQPRHPRKLAASPRLRHTVFALLAQHWSPEQIAHGLPVQYPGDPTMRISHEAIYTYLYVLPRGALRKELLRALRHHHHVRRPRKMLRLKSRPIQDSISIEERPAEVADRTVPGHWEGDLLMGHGNASALGTLVERTTRFTLLVPLTSKGATSVRQAFAHELRTLPQQLRRSLTYDQGQEMAEHRLFTQATQIQVYFAHPHCPWERGTCENTNGLLRQFFPKGTRFTTFTRRNIKHVQKLFNRRPRETLGWRTPAEVFAELLH